MNLQETFLTLSEVAKLLRRSPEYTKQIWPKFTKYGVNPIRIFGNGQPLFKKSEILRMLENFRVIKD